MKKKAATRVVLCSNCQLETCHQILRSIEIANNSEHEAIQTWDIYLIGHCMGCKTVSFIHEWFCSEVKEYDPITNTDTLTVQRSLYPSRIGRAKLRGSDRLPEQVRSVYSEAFQAISEKMPILAGIGVRAIIETVSNAKKACGANLEQKIDALVKMGLITSEGSIVLHSLRFLGNAAAHEAKAHSEEELIAALDVIENLLSSVYLIPQLLTKLPIKNGRSGGKT